MKPGAGRIASLAIRMTPKSSPSVMISALLPIGRSSDVGGAAI
jgi:hypothetical protein